MKNNFDSFNLDEYLKHNNIDKSMHSHSGLTGLLNLFLVGKKATANHPITTLNPDINFQIVSVKIEGEDENQRIFVRGSETCWFGSSMWKLI